MGVDGIKGTMDEKTAGVIIPPNRLSKEALNGLVEEFILREGTDYGLHEYSLEDKKKHIFSQIESKRIVIVFDPNLESTSLMTQQQLKNHSPATEF